MPQVLDIEQAVLLLELEPPFDKRDVQLARRRIAKQWHPDIAPPGKQHEHERHLKAINEAADQLASIAEESRGGKRLQERGQGRGGRRAQAPRRGGRPRVRGGAAPARAERRQREARPVRLARARSLGRAPLRALPVLSRVGRRAASTASTSPAAATTSSSGRASPSSPGIRTVPAGSLQFVDFSKPDPGAERVERFMTAAKHALAEGNFKLAARRLVFARDAEPGNPAVLRLMTLAFWQAGDYSAAARSVRDWIRSEPERPAPYRYAARIYESMGALSQAVDAAERETEAAPNDGIGVGAPGPAAPAPLRPRGRARGAGARARDRAVGRGPARPRARRQPARATSAPRSRACEQATVLAPDSEVAWARLAHALARTDRITDCLEACDRALALADDPEVRDLREQVAPARPAASCAPA